MDLLMAIAVTVFTANVIAVILSIRIRDVKEQRERNSIQYRKQLFCYPNIIDLTEKEWRELDA